jgi:hypothetical protein
VDPQEENPPDVPEAETKAKPTPPPDATRTARPSWQTISASFGEGAAEPELPLVIPTFDPLTEPELPLQSEFIESVRASEAEAAEAPQPTAATETPDTSKATLGMEPKTALPMQRPAPSWAETDPHAVEPAKAEDETEPKSAVPMQKPAPSWAQAVETPAEPAGEPEPSPPNAPERSAPLTWPPRAKADADLPTQSDIWPPEPPTEPAMPAWPPAMTDEADSQLPNLPVQPSPADWNPASITMPAAPEASAPPASAETAPPTATTPPDTSPAKTVPPVSATTAAKTVPPATGPPPTVPPVAATTPAKTEPPAAPAPTVAPVPPVPPAPIPSVPATVPPAAFAAAPSPPPPPQPPAPAPAPALPGTTSHSSALPSVGTKGSWQSLASRPPAKLPQDPVTHAEDKSAAKQPDEPKKTDAPDWAPTLVIPPKAAKQPATDWPGVVEVPAWAPHISVDTGQPASSSTPAAVPPAPKPAEPQTAAPASNAPAPQPGPPALTSAASPSANPSAWAVVEQKRVDSKRITREIPSPEDRSYAEWFAWAKRGGAPAVACHAAAQAAFQALASGKDVSVAAQMAAAAMATPPLPVDAGRQTYCAWFSLGNIDLNFDQRRAHAFATAAVHALEAGADAKGAHAAGLEAAGIK